VFRWSAVTERLTPRRGPAEPAFVSPNLPLLQQLLDEFGLVHALDEDGDLVIRWEKANVFVFCHGERGEVLQARLYVNRRFAVESRGALTLLLDEWNRTKLFPKAYTVLPDDGMVGVCAECCHDFELGATREQLKYTLATWIDTLLRFAEWLDEQL
jgi:hypothetical protein